VIADGVSPVQNYRSQFDDIIRESGHPDLVEELRTNPGKPGRRNRKKVVCVRMFNKEQSNV
jgi:hypothetical protein